MTAPKNRSSKLRKVFYRTPGNRARVRYKRVRTLAAKCAVCGSRLQGVSAGRGLAKSQRRPGRAFGGSLCGNCAEAVLRFRARIADKAMELRDVDMEYKPYVEQIL
jgi:large subunit ribosomal protein L34e